MLELARLRQRRVWRVGIAYAVIGWFLARAAEFAFDNFGAPPWALKTFLFLLLLGLPVALVLAWASGDERAAVQAGEADDAAATSRFEIDDLELDVRSRKVRRQGEEIDLPKLSFDLFVALASAAPRVVTLDELSKSVWGDVVVSDETITQRVKMLRDSLDANGDKQHYIETVRGVGYRLRHDANSGAPQPAATLSRTPVIAIVAGVAVLAAGAFYLRDAAAPLPAATSPPATSIAVLPFVAMNETVDDEHFADGVTEEVLNALAQIPELLVTARTSSFHFKDRNLPVQEIADTLGVAHVVEGSVRRFEDRYRITAQLIRASDGFHLWSNATEHASNDPFGVQIDIAQQIAAVLEIVLDDAELQRMRNTGIDNPDAFIAYTKGMQLFDRAHGDTDGLGMLVEANRYFEQAIALAPRFSAAYAKHADYYSHVLLSLGGGVDIDGYTVDDIAAVSEQFVSDYDAAIRFAASEHQRRALALDKAIFTGTWNDLTSSIEGVLEEPGCATASWFDAVALPFGFADASRDMVDRWLACDPLNFEAHLNRIQLLTAIGDFEGLLAHSEDALQVIEHPLLRLVQVLALVGLDRIDEAEALVNSRPGDVVMQVGGTFWVAAARGDADTSRAALIEADTLFQFGPADRMNYFAIIGDRDTVNAIAAEADATPFGHMVLTYALQACYCGAVFDLSATPNFARLVDEAGLMWPPVTSIDWPLKTW